MTESPNIEISLTAGIWKYNHKIEVCMVEQNERITLIAVNDKDNAKLREAFNDFVKVSNQ